MSEKSDVQYSFCETVHAVGPWHIRRLTEKGYCLGGGADTPALCGRKVAWDVSSRIAVTPNLLKKLATHDTGYPCATCHQKYLEETSG